MTPFRTTVCVVLFAAIALGVVAMRHAQAATAVRVLEFESQWVSLRRQLWQAQARVARLKSPQRVYHRVSWYHDTLVPPHGNDVEKSSMRMVLNPPTG